MASRNRSGVPAAGGDPGRGAPRGHGRPGRLGSSSLWRDEQPQPLKASWDPVHESRDRGTRPPRAELPPHADGPGEPDRAGRGDRGDRTPRRRRSALGWFVHHYGWRAYAIPVLIVLTVVVLVQIGQEHRSSSTALASTPAPSGASVITSTVSGVPTTVTVTQPASTADASAADSTPAGTPATTGSTLSDPNGTYPAGLAFGDLPGGGAFVAQGKGTWHVVPGTTQPFGSGPTRKTFTVEVEDGIESSSDDKEFADKVVSALEDSRSWIGSGDYTFQRIDSGTPDFRVALTSQMTERRNDLCGWDIHLEASCYARDKGIVSINNARWTRGALSYSGDLGLYRDYAVNHEVGHALGFMHQPCAKDGGLAPVMMQQSWSVANNDLATLNPQLIPADGKVCKPNPYPYPLAAASSAGGSAPAGSTAASSPASGG
jgi:hypothetical protein